jgi:hypothetical protein
MRVDRNFGRVCAFALYLGSATAILVAPSSPCAVKCGNVLQSTSIDDIVCNDANFATSTGQTFQACIDCELTSTFTEPSATSDLYALLCMPRFLFLCPGSIANVIR